MSNESYDAFVQKFKPKKTTDDCYTPPEVYEAVKNWAVKELDWEGRPIVRPFYPGGDYRNYDYPKNCVVIDNPPFSILAQIIKFYEAEKIDYFLFRPALMISPYSTSHIGVGVNITYENGAVVNTSFCASKGPLLRTAPDLYRVVTEANETSRKNRKQKKELPVYQYPDNVIMGSTLNFMSKYGVEYATDTGYFTRRLDCQKGSGKTIFGGGYIVPEQEANRAREEANRAREEARLVRMALSDRISGFLLRLIRKAFILAGAFLLPGKRRRISAVLDSLKVKTRIYAGFSGFSLFLFTPLAVLPYNEAMIRSV